ncbi:MAG: EthD family reductase [Candidatus Binatia bacterium]
MVKTMFLCRRRRDISHERYVELLSGGHVPIALRHHPSMRRYVVNIVDESLGDAPELDSVGSLWFDSADDFHHRLYDSPEGEAIVARDVAGFMGGADAYATTEHVQRRRPQAVSPGDRAPGVKLLVALRRPQGTSHEQFVRHWLERHVPLVLADPRLRAYVTNVVDAPLRGDPPPLDGIAELAFDSAEDLGAHVALARESPLRDDLPRFVGAAFPYRVSEYVQR